MFREWHCPAHRCPRRLSQGEGFQAGCIGVWLSQDAALRLQGIGANLPLALGTEYNPSARDDALLQCHLLYGTGVQELQDAGDTEGVGTGRGSRRSPPTFEG